MPSIKLVALTLVAAAVPAFVGCAVDAQDADGENEVSVQEAISTKIEPGTFKLYTQARVTPNELCDMHTQLDLTATPSRAKLTEKVGGACEIYAFPNERTYRLRQTGTSCGSKIYAGSLQKEGKRHEITITDHRTRMCRDLVPARIIVEETAPAPDGTMVKTTRYSHDAAPAPASITVEGSLFSSMGIGGENTGASIQAADGIHELILDEGERNQFVDGKKARVTGKPTTLSGVETQGRRAIDVESMLVCPNPGWINCMPGPNVRLSNLCANENRDWLKANCEGVDFAF